MSNVGSGIAAGAAAGAASGAGVGTAASPGIGTAIGAAIGAIGGAIAGGVKSKQDEKNREKEVKRVEEREDNAIRRATADALLSGIDPRSSGQVPNAAGAASVAPQETQETLSDYVQAGGQLSNAFQKRVDLDVETQQLVGSSYQKFLVNADNQYQSTLMERDRLSIDMATRLNVSKDDITKTIDAYQIITRTSDESIDGWRSSQEYHDFVDKIDSTKDKDFSSYTESDWDSLYNMAKQSYTAGINAGKNSSDQDSHSSNRSAKTRSNPEANSPLASRSTPEKLVDTATDIADGFMDKNAFIASMKAAYEYSRQNGTAEGYGHSHDHGWAKDKEEGTKVTTGSKTTSDFFHSALKSTVNKSIDSYTTEKLFGSKDSKAFISKEDQDRYMRSINLLTNRMQFFEMQRNVDYPEYVSRYYGRLRSHLRSMQYGPIDQEFGYDKHIYSPSRDYDFEFGY